jgi:hypothetical protein
MGDLLEGVASFALDVGVLALIVAFGAAVVFGFEKAVDYFHWGHRRRKT